MGLPFTVYDAILGTGNTLGQISQMTWSPNAQPVPHRTSGGINPSEIYGGQETPVWTAETFDIGGALGFIDVAAGDPLTSETITLPFQERATGSTYKGATSHNTISAAEALTVFTGFQASQGGDATASVSVHLNSTDGVTDPYTENQNQSLASASFNAAFTLGPVYFNATILTGVRSVSIDPGLSVLPNFHSGGRFPIDHYIQTRSPTFSVTFTDADDIYTNNAALKVMTSAVAYFRKRSGASYATGSNHISFTFADGLRVLDSASASGNEDGSVTITLLGETLTASAAAAIP